MNKRILRAFLDLVISLTLAGIGLTINTIGLYTENSNMILGGIAVAAAAVYVAFAGIFARGFRL